MLDYTVKHFDEKLLAKARSLFPLVYVDNLSDDGIMIIGSESANVAEGFRIRLFYSDWEYEDATIIRSNEELEKIVNDELHDRVWYLQHELV